MADVVDFFTRERVSMEGAPQQVVAGASNRALTDAVLSVLHELTALAEAGKITGAAITFIRPDNTTAHAIGGDVYNSAVAGSLAFLQHRILFEMREALQDDLEDAEKGFFDEGDDL